jgi:hypothetical protein
MVDGSQGEVKARRAAAKAGVRNGQIIAWHLVLLFSQEHEVPRGGHSLQQQERFHAHYRPKDVDRYRVGDGLLSGMGSAGGSGRDDG